MFPGAAVGILTLSGVTNPSSHPALDREKSALEEDLRSRFGTWTRLELRALPTLQAYAAYYRRFDKTYHVQLQLESVALKQKPIPSVAALVEAMFMTELKNQLLTAGHDVATLAPPIELDAVGEPRPYTLANGKPGELKPGDMYMADGQGVICSILYGQDQRTRLSASTTGALFVVYAPAGIGPDAATVHLHDIVTNVRLFAPDAKVETLEVHGA